MLRECAAESLVTRNHLGSSELRPNSGGWKRREFSTIGQNSSTSRRGESEIGAVFLSETDAATYLGMSIAQLIGLRKFDLAMIEEGFKPHGPPPLWRGGICSYASENLEEWIRNQSATRLK